MAKSFVPLTLDLIEEGSFAREANGDLLRLQRELLRHVEVYGPEAKGATAVLTLKIKLKCEDPEQELYTIKTTSNMQTPARPAGVSAAVADFTEDHKPALFVRKSGSDRGDPRQNKLSTADGRTIGEGGSVSDE